MFELKELRARPHFSYGFFKTLTIGSLECYLNVREIEKNRPPESFGKRLGQAYCLNYLF